MSLLQKPWFLLAVFVLACGPAGAQSPGPESVAFPLSLCVSCHGENGAGIADGIPAIGGQHEDYLNDRLKKFALPDSGSDLMRDIVAGLSEKELQAAAAYFARLPYVRKKQTGDPLRISRGKEVYERVCQICHHDEGKSTAYAEYPLLAGQNLVYLEKTMGDVLAGRRKIDLVKENMISLLFGTPERIGDALHFFAAQEVEPSQVNTRINEGQKQRRRRFKAVQ